jgi:RimJ/RimL family protein N-acetyltransferase
MLLRPIQPADRAEIADLIHASVNAWYQQHGMSRIFNGPPDLTNLFYDVYHTLEPGCAFVAESETTGRLMGVCFYHPRETHTALGIMSVHPNYFGTGAGRALLHKVIDYADSSGSKSIRLTQSALNLDSFSLYNRAGFVPRGAYQDMILRIPDGGLAGDIPGRDRVRDAQLTDLPALAALEMEISGVRREVDYRFCIENPLGFMTMSVIESVSGGIDGFLASSSHPASNMIGPGVCRSDASAIALLHRELDRHRGRSPVVLIPVDREGLVRQMYGWGARNCELHFCQVRGTFQPFRGINFPTFVMETA